MALFFYLIFCANLGSMKVKVIYALYFGAINNIFYELLIANEAMRLEFF